MNPNYFIGLGFAAALFGTRLVEADEKLIEQRKEERRRVEEQMKADAEARRLASPVYAAAEAKRERKRKKLAAIASRGNA